ncbi:hypothetical protein NA78x_001786 [Anatilimnocola sp. NA78]|uniref:hypothetical protein n=1 Tax=Anatilimnocola sp. NA78 TaxID=3415683 RepID=UPI003CE5837C
MAKKSKQAEVAEQQLKIAFQAGWNSIDMRGVTDKPPYADQNGRLAQAWLEGRRERLRNRNASPADRVVSAADAVASLTRHFHGAN